MSYAPIITFAFNRLEALRNTISSLSTNDEAKDSELFVFVDGPRAHKVGEDEKINDVQEYVKTIKGFKSLNYRFSDTNKGLGPSIIAGVTEIIEKYGKAIIIEDDLIVTSNFLSFINQGLEKYKDCDDVFSICGYTNKIRLPKEYTANSYFCVRSSSWGWATWADRWNTIDWELKDWESYRKLSHDFNKWGGSDCWSMLNKWHKGVNQSWAIRFCFTQFLQNKITLFPTMSLVKNNGFDGNGTNCKSWSRFKHELDKSGKKDFSWPTTLKVNPQILKESLKYHSISIRIFSKLMYLIHR